MSWSREEEETRVEKGEFRGVGLREYCFEYQVVRYLTESIPAGPQLKRPCGENSLTVRTHRQGNLKAKRDINPAPYPSKLRDGGFVYSWKRGESNSVEVYTTSRFDADLAELFEVGEDAEARHFAMVENGARSAHALKEVSKLDGETRRAVLDSVRTFLDGLDPHRSTVYLYLKERGRWDAYRAVEGLKEGGSARWVAVLGDSLFLEGEPEVDWAGRFGLKRVVRWWAETVL